MTKRNRQAVQDRRWEKKETQPTTRNEKHQEYRSQAVRPLVAKNNNQKKALAAFPNKQLCILEGSSGVGKSELMCWWASRQWLLGEIDNIVITRPHKHLGDDYGAVKGSDAEKLLPFCMSMLTKLKKYLGVGVLRNNFKLDGFDVLWEESRGIQIIPVEKIQGLSFDNRTIILADEVQNMTVAQVKALTTRMEEGCQLICCGDPKQTAIGKNNGLTYLVDKLNKHPHKDVFVVEFTPSDCCRSGISAHLTNIYEQDGNW